MHVSIRTKNETFVESSNNVSLYHGKKKILAIARKKKIKIDQGEYNRLIRILNADGEF